MISIHRQLPWMHGLFTLQWTNTSLLNLKLKDCKMTGYGELMLMAFLLFFTGMQQCFAVIIVAGQLTKSGEVRVVKHLPPFRSLLIILMAFLYNYGSMIILRRSCGWKEDP